MKKVKINLGCGDKYLQGYINCDVLTLVKADKYFDLNKFPYPFNKESIDEILLDNVLEHLDDIPAVMRELHRIARSKCIIRIYVPYGKSDWAIQDPTHKHYFTERSMKYFCRNSDYAFYTEFKFKLLKNELVCHNTTLLHRIRNIIPLRNFFRYFLFNMYDEIHFQIIKE